LFTLAVATGFAGVLDGEAGRWNSLRPRNLSPPLEEEPQPKNFIFYHLNLLWF
jgi:hypothetical protein